MLIEQVAKVTQGPQSFAADDFVTPQPPELQCLKCRNVPRTPKRSHCCNSLYCEECSATVTYCPVHKESVEHFTDSALRSRISKLTIHCGYKCGWKGPTYKLKDHLLDCEGKSTVEPTCKHPAWGYDDLNIIKTMLVSITLPLSFYAYLSACRKGSNGSYS